MTYWLLFVQSSLVSAPELLPVSDPVVRRGAVAHVETKRWSIFFFGGRGAHKCQCVGVCRRAVGVHGSSTERVRRGHAVQGSHLNRGAPQDVRASLWGTGCFTIETGSVVPPRA